MDFESLEAIGEGMHSLAKKLWPINRCLVGPGILETLEIIKDELPEMSINKVPSGHKAFDWTVPNSWEVKEAWIKDVEGNKIVDFSTHNLHIVAGSHSVNQKLTLDQLQEHLHSRPYQPTAIPYIASYYKPYWGFCLQDELRKNLKPGEYHAYIDAVIEPGFLTYGEILIKGNSTNEIFLSTYICHPSMANNELSGPCVATYLAKWIKSIPERRYSYRIIFIPETIGSIVYLSKNHEQLKRDIKAGFNITCIGDEKEYSYLPSRMGDSISDRAAKHALSFIKPDFKQYSYLERGSDERQYCSPGMDLPIATIMRSKYEEFPEYHSSLDDLELVTPSGLFGGYMALKRSIDIIENNYTPIAVTMCEPQLGKRGLYPNLSQKTAEVKVHGRDIRLMMNLLAYSDGKLDLLSISEIIQTKFDDVFKVAKILENSELLKLRHPTDE